MIDQLAEHFDYVIIDSAPVLPVADSIALAGAVDAVLFVAQANRDISSQRRRGTRAARSCERPGHRARAQPGQPGGNARTYGYGYDGGYELPDSAARNLDTDRPAAGQVELPAR